ncbi:MAG TPA: hypothetical protein DCZ48_01565 [Methylococcaceae bacterium]|nr:hypothetical protein [Methylococcaceae bacterium]
MVLPFYALLSSYIIYHTIAFGQSGTLKQKKDICQFTKGSTIEKALWVSLHTFRTSNFGSA